MAWTSETYVGHGWTVYHKDSLAGGSAEEIDTREASRVIFTATGDGSSGGAGEGTAVLQYAMAPTASAAGSTWIAPPAETGLTANTANVHNDVVLLSRSVLPPWIRIANSDGTSGDTVTNIRVLVKRVAHTA